MRERLLIFLGATIVVATIIANARADEIKIMIPAFDGGPIGINVGTVLNLKVWRTLRVPPPNPQHYQPGGTAIWTHEPLPESSHEEAERWAEAERAQMILWGNAVKISDGALVQCFLSIPQYNDSREQHPEVWSVKLPIDGSTVEMGVSLPRRRYEFSPINLAGALVDQYYLPSFLRLYSTKGGNIPVGEVGNSFRARRHEGDYTELVSESGRVGWVYLPKLDAEVEIINFAGGLVRLFRADYSGAVALLKKLPGSPASTSLKIDALLLEAIAKAKQSEDPVALIDAAIALNPHLQTSIKFKVASLISKYIASVDSSEQRGMIADELRRVVVRNEYLFSVDDEWIATAHKALDYILTQSKRR